MESRDGTPEDDESKMKYNKERGIRLVTSASALANNLIALDVHKYGVAASIAVIHNGYINIIPVYNPEEKSKYLPCIAAGTTPRKITAEVVQVLWGILKEKKVFVVASTLGVQVYLGGDLKTCCHHYMLSVTSAGDTAYFVRGLAIIDHQFLCIGTSNGSICVLLPREEENEMELVERKMAHGKAVTDLASLDEGVILASADETGMVTLWELMCQRLQRLFNIDYAGFPCTSLKLWNNLVIAAYGSGHIRTFHIDSGCCVSEVAAHAKWISAIDVATERGYVLSVAEDSFAKVWQITATNNKLCHVWTTRVEDNLLMGGRFLNKCGSIFCVSSYDSAEVHCYAMEQLPMSH